MTSGLLTIRLLKLPTREQLAAAHDPDPAKSRALTIVHVQADDGGAGWGECSALNEPTYTDEFAEGAFNALSQGNPKSSVMPMAAAAMEMAGLDARLKQSNTSLAGWLGAEAATVKAGIAVGLLPLDELAASVGEAIEAGYRRVKIKLTPGDAVQRVRLLRSEFKGLDFELHGDANGSFDAASAMEVREALGAGLDLIEQPFRPEDVLSAVALVADVEQPVIADEAVETLEDARRLHQAGALTGVTVKPPRMGGLGPAVELLQWCRNNGVACAAGGMLESGLGRRSLAAFAALDGMTLTGDVSPARRWLAEDPWPDLDFAHGRISVPTSAGIAPEPDLELLDRLTVRRSERRIP